MDPHLQVTSIATSGRFQGVLTYMVAPFCGGEMQAITLTRVDPDVFTPTESQTEPKTGIARIDTVRGCPDESFQRHRQEFECLQGVF